MTEVVRQRLDEFLASKELRRTKQRDVIVEAAFSTLPYIHEAAVIYEKISPDLGQIKAFVSVAGTITDTRTILNEIKNLLPSYMVPKTLVILSSLPKNSNGKIDRKQLVQQV